MRCSACGGPRIGWTVRHTLRCPSFRLPATYVRDVLYTHPDLAELDAEMGYWFPGDADAGMAL